VAALGPGDTAVIVERQRPIVLRHHFAVHRREDEETVLLPLLHDNGRPGGEGLRIDQAVRRALQGRSVHWQPRGRGPRLPYRAPLRTEMVEELGQREMLPAIVFIFSRAACDDAVRQVLRDGVRLTDAQERAAIRQVASAASSRSATRTWVSSGTTSGSRGWNGAWRPTTRAGPLFRETVEECFAAGLLKVVFATETLSLGINMPARSVVIERFTKYGGRGVPPSRRGVPPAHGARRPARAGRGGSRRRGLVDRDHVRGGGAGRIGATSRPALGLPSHLQPGRQPDLAVRPRHRQRRPAPVVRQWQARQPDLLSRQLGHRVAVLEQMGYVDDWALTPPVAACPASTTRPTC